MKKLGPMKITYTEFYCHPCKYLDRKLLESPLVNLSKTIKRDIDKQYQASCIHSKRREFNQINKNLVTPVWCPYLNK